jgi:3-deoxy-7-phosphoheptulonate synthase
MIIKMMPGASDAQVGAVEERICQEGYEPRTIRGVGMSVIAVVGKRPEYLIDKILSMSGVDQCIPIEKPYKLAARDFQSEWTEIPLGQAVLGSQDITVMAGPCTVETREQLLTTARGVKAHGAHVLRGGAFKPRSSPYAFQGLGEDGLKLLDEARAISGLPIITEVMEPGTVDVVQRYADVLQVGARNCQNYPLLREVGKARKPVMIKRGPSVTIDEWIMAAEYVLHGGNMQVMMCERGIKTFENYTRNTLDLSAIPAIKRLTHLPVIVDPSHGTGKWHLVRSMCLASVAAGADGVLIEVHPTPDTALCDGAQSLTIENFAVAAIDLARVAAAVGRRVPGFEADGTFVGGGSYTAVAG